MDLRLDKKFPESVRVQNVVEGNRGGSTTSSTKLEVAQCLDLLLTERNQNERK